MENVRAFVEQRSGIRRFRVGRILSRGLFLCLFIALVFLSRHTSLAQTTSTEILGTVTDASGAVITGARVTVVRLATGEKREATTGASGNY